MAYHYTPVDRDVNFDMAQMDVTVAEIAAADEPPTIGVGLFSTPEMTGTAIAICVVSPSGGRMALLDVAQSASLRGKLAELERLHSPVGGA